MLTAQRFINLREAADDEKQSYYEDVCRLFRLRTVPDTFPLRDSTDLPPHILKRLDRTPVIVSYLETYDSRHGTNFADRARGALFQFANLVIKSDGTVTPTEAAALAELKQTLYPEGVRAPADSAAVTRDANVTGDAGERGCATGAGVGAVVGEEAQAPPRP